jgi:5'-phosphate synthase pdxT subunit
MKDFSKLTIGVLALQGDFELHVRQLEQVGAAHRLVKLPADLEGLDGLIMPGGESSTMHTLIERFGLRSPIREFARSRPIYGTCAGMILLSRQIEDNQFGVESFGLIDISVVRTGWGRQVFSFEDDVSVLLNGSRRDIGAAFIRAPVVTKVGEGVAVLGTYRNSPVLVTQDNILAASFHNELDNDAILLRHFLGEFCWSAADK